MPLDEGWTIERAEKLLNSLVGVVSARVVARPGGSVEEIHLLATSDLTPKQIVRNVESALLAQLDVGEVSYRVGSEEKLVAVSGGFAEVLQTGVSILAETAEPAEEIDLDRAQRAREDARTQLESGPSEHESSVAQLRLKRADSRIRVRGQIR